MKSVPAQRPLRAVAAFELVSIVAGLLSAVIGGLVLIGWWRDINALRTIIPGLIPTIPNTAVAAILGGLAVLGIVGISPGMIVRSARCRATSRSHEDADHRRRQAGDGRDLFEGGDRP